ncbi:DNA helicase Ino80 like protein, partial [Aduncisulcus paluster]
YIVPHEISQCVGEEEEFIFTYSPYRSNFDSEVQWRRGSILSSLFLWWSDSQYISEFQRAIRYLSGLSMYDVYMFATIRLLLSNYSKFHKIFDSKLGKSTIGDMSEWIADNVKMRHRAGLQREMFKNTSVCMSYCHDNATSSVISEHSSLINEANNMLSYSFSMTNFISKFNSDVVILPEQVPFAQKIVEISSVEFCKKVPEENEKREDEDKIGDGIDIGNAVGVSSQSTIFRLSKNENVLPFGIPSSTTDFSRILSVPTFPKEFLISFPKVSVPSPNLSFSTMSFTSHCGIFPPLVRDCPIYLLLSRYLDDKSDISNRLFAPLSQKGISETTSYNQENYSRFAYLTSFSSPSDVPQLQMSSIITSSGKMRVLDQLLPKLLRENHRCLIYCQMTKMMDIIQEYLYMRGYKFVRFDGSFSMTDRQALISRFMTETIGTPVWIRKPWIGFIGLDKRNPDWNPSVDSQAMDRVHRVGQTKPVTVYRLVIPGSIEDYVLERAGKKGEMQRMVLADR